MFYLFDEELKIFYNDLEIFDNGLYLTSQVHVMYMGLDEEKLSKILSLPTLGIMSVKLKKGSTQFLKLCGVLDGLLTENSYKRVLKEEFQLLFKLVANALFARSNKETTLTGANLVLMEILFTYKRVNLPAIVIKNMNTMINDKAGRYVIPYGL